MWVQLLQLLNPAGIISNVLEGRKHKRETKAAIQQQRLSNIEAGRVSEAQWNIKAIENSGWKDEWLTLVLSMPLVLAFIPIAVPHLHAGFAVLETMPIWYQSALAVMIASSFGYQKYATTKMNKAFTLPSGSA